MTNQKQEAEKKRYVHAGIRIRGTKKSMIIFLLNDADELGTEMSFPADAHDKNFLGLIFEGEFEESSATLPTNKSRNLGQYKDANKIFEWLAIQNKHLAMAKQPSIKAETLKDLAERLEPERTAYQSALKRGDYETAQSIKDMVDLILTKAP